MPTPRTIFAAVFAVAVSIAFHLYAGEMLSGTGAPAANVGADGDHYLRTDTSALYKKTDGAWSVLSQRLANKGDQGERGVTGQRGLVGPIGPAGPGLRTFDNNTALTSAVPQFIGQLALRLDNQSLWRGTATTAGAWTLIPTVGPQGEAGIAFNPVLHTMSAPVTITATGAAPEDQTSTTLTALAITVDPHKSVLVVGHLSFTQPATDDGSGITVTFAGDTLLDRPSYHGAVTNLGVNLNKIIANTTDDPQTYHVVVSTKCASGAGGTGTIAAGARTAQLALD